MILRTLELDESLDSLLRSLAESYNTSKSELMQSLIIYALYTKRRIPQKWLKEPWVKRALKMLAPKELKKRK